jgi:hypothetical protein
VNAEHIKATLLKTPLKPIQIELDSGRKFILKHPDYAFFNTNEKAMIITDETGFEVIDLNHVVSVKRQKAAH